MKQRITLVITLFLSIHLSFAQLNLQWQNMGPDNFGAFVTGLIIDKRDTTHQTLYASTAGAGVWKSTNQGDWWEQLPCMGNALASCIAQAGDGTIYVGTGLSIYYPDQGSSFSLGSAGNGVYRIDVTDNATHLSSTTATPANQWIGVNDIAVNPTNAAHILCATIRGFYSSTDGGNTWNEVSIQGVSYGLSALDIEWSADGQKIFAVVGGNNKVARSLNGGLSWIKISEVVNPDFPPTQGRIGVAMSPSNSDVVYASIARANGSYYGLFKSTNAGTIWDTVALPNATFSPVGPANEGWFCNAVAVMPNNPDKVLVGSTAMFGYSPSTGPVKLNPFAANYLTPTASVHQFKYVMDDQNSDIMYVVTSEGIFKSTNANDQFGNIKVYWKSAGIRGVGFHNVAAAIDGTVMGGDNEIGTLISQPGSSNFRFLHKNFSFCEFSHLSPNTLFIESSFGGLKRSSDGGQTFDTIFDSNIDPQKFAEPSRCGGWINQNAQFINPYLLHETTTAFNSIDKVPYTATTNHNTGDTVLVTSNTASTTFKYALPIAVQAGQTIQVPDAVKSRLFFASSCGGWVRTRALQADTLPLSWYKFTPVAQGQIWSFAATKDGNTVYTGNSLGRVLKTSGFNTIQFTGIYMQDSLQQQVVVVDSNRAIEGIAVDPNNDNHVICTIAGYSATKPNVYKSTDGGLTWTGMQVGPASTPAYSCVIDQINGNRYIVGTENGIWTSDDAGATWQQENTPLCNVPVYRVRQIPLYKNECPVLYAATQSSGIWRSVTLTPAGCNLSVGMSEVATNNQSLQLYPNPTNGSVTYVVPSAEVMGGVLRVYDLTGKELLSRLINAVKIELNLSQLSKGLYVVAAEKGEVRQFSKLMID